MVTFGEDAERAIAPFFASKSGGRQRLALDARKVNDYFREPAAVELPTAGVWNGLRTRESDELVVDQLDIEAAFYRMPAPAGLSELMVLPRFTVAEILSIGPLLPVRSIKGMRTAPRLAVLPMG